MNKTAKYNSPTELRAQAMTESTQTAKQQALLSILNAGLIGTGGGLALRGIAEALAARRKKPWEKVKQLPAPMPKLAGWADGVSGAVNSVSKAIPNAARYVGHLVSDTGNMVSNPIGFMSGDYATKAKDIPWRGAGNVLAIGGGGLLGWKLLDKYFSEKRKANRLNKLEEYQTAYEQALRGLSQPAETKPEAKAAAAQSPAEEVGRELGQVLDELFEEAAPQIVAEHGKTAGLGSLLSAYGAAAIIPFTAAAIIANKQSRDVQRESVLMKAIRERRAQQRQQQLATPTLAATSINPLITNQSEEKPKQPAPALSVDMFDKV